MASAYDFNSGWGKEVMEAFYDTAFILLTPIGLAYVFGYIVYLASSDGVKQ